MVWRALAIQVLFSLVLLEPFEVTAIRYVVTAVRLVFWWLL